jgi:hypothetical protein
MLRNQAQSRSSVAARMPKLSNKQLFDLLRVHEENLAALRDCATKPAKHEQVSIYKCFEYCDIRRFLK